MPVLQREAGACHLSASGGAGAAARALSAVDIVLSSPGAVGGPAQLDGAGEEQRALLGALL